MDEVLLHTSDVESGLINLREVSQIVRKAGLTFRLSTCQIFMGKIEYLGHEINKDGVHSGQRKIEAVSKFPTPTDLRTVRPFLGLSEYYFKYDGTEQ